MPGLAGPNPDYRGVKIVTGASPTFSLLVGNDEICRVYDQISAGNETFRVFLLRVKREDGR